MCFHTSTITKTKKLEQYFNVKLNEEVLRPIFDKPQYHLNGFAHPNMLVIPQQKREVLAPGVWGIVPDDKSKDEILPYFKEAVKYGGGLNARSEKLFNHFIYNSVIHEQRCIIPVSGFYEPHEYKKPHGKKKEKCPFLVQDIEKEPLALAGIYTVIDTHITFSILTKEASPLLAKVHNVKKRQPVILDLELTKDWLDPNLTDKQITEITKYNYPNKELLAYTVSKDLFSPKVDSNIPSILENVEYDGVKI